jgi:hypothetical protein
VPGYFLGHIGRTCTSPGWPGAAHGTHPESGSGRGPRTANTQQATCSAARAFEDAAGRRRGPLECERICGGDHQSGRPPCPSPPAIARPVGLIDRRRPRRARAAVFLPFPIGLAQFAPVCRGR